MTVTAVRSSVRTTLEAVAGVFNVDDEEPWGREPDASAAARLHAGAPHFWLVKVNALASGGGAGYVEPRRRVRVEGFIGLAPDDGSGISSYKRAADLEAAVLAALQPSAVSLDVESVTPDGEIPLVEVPIGDRAYTCHRIGLTAVIIEVT